MAAEVGGAIDGAEESAEGMELSADGRKRPFGGGTNGPAKKREHDPVRVSRSKVLHLESLFEKFIYSPPQLLQQSVHWINDDVARFILPSTPEFLVAMHNIQTKYSKMTYNEFVEFYKQQRYYIFRAGTVYHDVEASVKLANQWLEEQSNAGGVGVYEGNTLQYVKLPVKVWLQKIADVLCRRVRKRFCLVLNGPNSCGKTWFTNMFLDFFINKGEMNNFSRYENLTFPFMNLVNRRIGLWNEAFITGDPSQREHLKVLFEGESKSVSVKNVKDGIVMNVPMIVTTNNRTFETDIAFRDRQHIFKCEKINLLRGGEHCPGRKSLHPFAIPILFAKYNIETDESCSKDSAPQVISLSDYLSMLNMNNDVITFDTEYNFDE